MFKLMKMISDSETPSNYNFRTKPENKIKAIPIIYSKFQHQKSPQVIQRIPAKGYKNISRAAAIGESTIDTLHRIKRTTSLKYMRGLEFDPYFCDISGLKQLIRALRNFKKTLVYLSLVLRRVTIEGEIEVFGPVLARLKSLTKLRIELPHTQGISLKDTKALMKSCRKCELIRSLEIHLVGLPVLPNNYRSFGGVFERLRKLEHVIYHIQTNHVKNGGDLKQQAKVIKAIKVENLKSLSLKFAFKTGWASFYDGAGVVQILPTFLRSLSATANPTRLSLTFDKFQLSTNAVSEIANILPRFSNLRFFYLEVINVKIGEFETLVLAKGILECKQIEHFTFKHIDNLIIPLLDVFQFITLMNKFALFPKFDIFFRKLFYPEWNSIETRRKLDEMENIKYSLTKQSIHISKIQPTEQEV